LNQICTLTGMNLVCNLDNNNNDVSMRFAEHMSAFGLSYATKEEYFFRLNLFKSMDAEINESNLNPENTFVLEHNQFSTMTASEK